jgi:hypothetical protein
MATSVGSILVKIGADTDDLIKGVNRAEGALAKVGKSAIGIGKIIASAVAAAGAAIGAMALKGIELGNELARTARIVGLTAAELGGLHHAAALSEVSTEQLDKGLQRLGRTVSDADSGLKSAVRTLQELGLNANEMEQLPLSEQFLKVTDAMKGMTSQGDKLRIATQLFGKAGAEMIPLLDESSDAIRGMMEESRALGLQLDETQSRIVQEASDSLDRMKGAFKGLSMQLGATFAPAIEAAADAITKISAAVTASLPAWSAWLTRVLGIRRELDDLTKSQAQAEINDNFRELLETQERLKRLEAGRGSFMLDSGRADLENRINENLAKQADLRQRNGDLLDRIVRLAKQQPVDIEPTGGGSEEGDDSGAREIEERQKAAERLTQQMQTDLEKQVQSWHEARELFNQGLISEETLTRVRDSLLQPIEVSAQAMKQITDDRFAELVDRYKTESQLEQERYAEELAVLEERRAAELSSLEEYNALKEQIEARHQEAITDIFRKEATARQQFEAMDARQKTATVLGTLEDITAGIAQYSEKAFKLNKLAAIGNAIVNMHEGMTKALAQGGFFGIAMAAAVAAKGLASIAAIKKTQFRGGGTGTTPSAAGGSMVNSNPVPSAVGGGTGKTNNIRVEGINQNDIFTGRALRELLERLKDAQKDGGTLVIA